MCKLSVIVPLYNGEKTIARCLKSLCRQTFEDMEILVVNDGSVDRGPDIVRSYGKRDGRIRMITQENQGLGAARNFGIREARGKYVGFVDCDDFVDKDMFRIMVHALEVNKVSVAVCQEKNVYVDNDRIRSMGGTRFPAGKTMICDSGLLLQWITNYTYMSLNSMCYKVVARSIFTDRYIEVPEQYRHAEDLVASVGILSQVDRVAVIPRDLYYYVHTKGSLSYSYSLRHAEDVYRDWEEVCAYIRESGHEISLDNFSLGMYFASLKQISWSRNKQERKSGQARRLKEKWREARRLGGWRPDFSCADVPFLHKVKICVAYAHLCRPAFAVISLLRWIPLFKYMM